MSYLAEWVGFCAASPANEAAAAVLVEGEGYERSLDENGWTWYRHPDLGHFEFAIDVFVSEVSRTAVGPASGGWVFESSFALIAGSVPDGTGFRLMVDEPGEADGEEEDQDANRWAQTASTREAIEAAAADLAHWSRHAPRVVTKETMLAWTPALAYLKPIEHRRYRPPQDPDLSHLFFYRPNPWITYYGPEPWLKHENEASWLYAEDGVRLVFDLLGFPAFDRITHPPEESSGADDRQADEAESPDPRCAIPGWERWEGSEEEQYWAHVLRDLGWGRTNRRWGKGAETFFGAREFALLPEPVGGFEGPPGDWIGLAVENFDRHTGEEGPAGLVVIPIAAVDPWHRGFPDVDAAKRELATAHFGRSPTGWRPVPDGVGRTWKETLSWLLAEVRT